jgi:hypothetical protein
VRAQAGPGGATTLSSGWTQHSPVPVKSNTLAPSLERKVPTDRERSQRGADQTPRTGSQQTERSEPLPKGGTVCDKGGTICDRCQTPARAGPDANGSAPPVDGRERDRGSTARRWPDTPNWKPTEE